MVKNVHEQCIRENNCGENPKKKHQLGIARVKNNQKPK
jgi:hypothetical protein